jgi:hypothetical protein
MSIKEKLIRFLIRRWLKGYHLHKSSPWKERNRITRLTAEEALLDKR